MRSVNLFNIAFYALQKKQKLGEAHLPDGQEFEPTGSVSTSKPGSLLGAGTLEIRGKDNGVAFLRKYSTKPFNPSLLPNQPDKEQDWVCPWLMILLPKNMAGS